MAKKNKETLILGQKSEPKEQMTFNDPGSRPNPDVETDLSNKETPYNKVDFPEPPEGQSSYEELLASEEYQHALDKLAEITGLRNIGVGMEPGSRFMTLTIQGLRNLNIIMNTETNHEEELEELCGRTIRNYFKIPERALQFNFKLVKEAIKVNKPQNQEEEEQRDEEMVEDVNELTPERAKRRLINAMTQGHAVNGMYLFESLTPELQRITGVRNIVEQYDVFTATAMLGYWHFPNEEINRGMGGGGENDEDIGGGKVRIDTTTNPPTINAEAMVFPFLIHEAIKGVMEFLGKERNPENQEAYETAMDLEDQVQHEIWDIRLGPAIWRRLVNLMPEAIQNDENQKKLQFWIYGNIANLPVKEFLVFFKEMLKNPENAKMLIGAMYYDISRLLEGDDLPEDEQHFKIQMRHLMEQQPPDVDDEIDDMLAQLGIHL